MVIFKTATKILKILVKTSFGFRDYMEERWASLSVAGCRSMDQLVLVYSLEGGQCMCPCGGPELCTFRTAALLMKHLHLRK